MEYREKPVRMAKIIPPRIRKVYPRKRLLRQLQEASDLAVVWISAPAGSGKTTLIADYLANRNQTCLWFQLDSGDADPATFFHYLGLAAENLSPHQHIPMPRLSPGHLSGLPTFTRHYFKTLYLRLKSPAVLVFDNFQELPADAPLHALFSEALAGISEGLQIIFLSRNKPPAWFAPLQAQQIATLLGWEELRLTEDESLGIARLFESSNPHKHPEQVIHTLHQQTRGWAAGLILMLQAIENEDVAIDAVTGCARETIFNYFASELFDKADPEEQIFLLKSALLPNMSLPAVTEFTDHQHADAIFRRLHKRNYFVTHRGGANPVYEYHPLFREFLLARGTAVWSREQLREVRLQAARALHFAQQPEQAIELLLLAAEWTEATAAILERAPTLLSQGRLHTLKAWLERLPQNLPEHSSWLSYWLAICQTGQHPQTAEQLFGTAFSLFEAEKNLSGMYQTIAAATELAWMTQQDHRRIDPWLARFEKLYPQQPAPSQEIEAKAIACALMGYYFRKPNHPLVTELIDRAEQLWNSPLELNLRWQLGTAIFPFLFGRGKLVHWMETIRLFEPDSRSGTLTPEVHLSVLVAVTFGELFRGHYESSLEHAERGLELAQKSNITLLNNWLLGYGASSALFQADLPVADRYLKKMHTNLATLPPNLDTALYQMIMSWRSLFDQDYPQALEHAQAALKLAHTIGSIYPVALCHYVLAHALFESGDPPQAFHTLEQACIPWGDGKHQQLLFYSRFSGAGFQLRLGQTERAVELLEQALLQGATQGYGLPLCSRPNLVEPLLRLALEQNIETGYVQRLIQQAKIVPDNPTEIPERWPMPVRVYTLGKFSLQVNGKLLSCSARTKNRPIELLKAIIAFGGQDVAQEKVMDALWPDASGDTALKSMHTTLHRLRKLLGIEESVILKDGYLSLDARHVWVDIRCLEQVLNRIGHKLGAPTIDPDAIARLTRTAERLFQGPFLDSEASRPWSIAPAERIRNRLIRTILSLGHFWENRGDWERAVSCYQCGLELDPLTELFYRHLMHAYFKQGNHADALATYERCRKVLASTLGIMPGQKTVRLYQLILARSAKSQTLSDNS